MWADARVHSRCGFQPQHNSSSHLEPEGFLRSQGSSLGKGEVVSWSALVVGMPRGNPHPVGSQEAADPCLGELSRGWFTQFPKGQAEGPHACWEWLSCLFSHPCLLHPVSLCFRFHLPNTTCTQILVHDLFLEKSKLRQLERKIKSSLAFTLPSHWELTLSLPLEIARSCQIQRSCFITLDLQVPVDGPFPPWHTLLSWLRGQPSLPFSSYDGNLWW